MIKLREYNENDLSILKDYKALFNLLNKNAIKYVILKDDVISGFIVLDFITAMNEYKLGKLYFDFLDESLFDLINDLFDSLLKEFIINNSYLKITCDLSASDINKIEFLKEHNFIENKNQDNIVELKITKPIYLERNK